MPRAMAINSASEATGGISGRSTASLLRWTQDRRTATVLIEVPLVVEQSVVVSVHQQPAEAVATEQMPHSTIDIHFRSAAVLSSCGWQLQSSQPSSDASPNTNLHRYLLRLAVPHSVDPAAVTTAVSSSNVAIILRKGHCQNWGPNELQLVPSRSHHTAAATAPLLPSAGSSSGAAISSQRPPSNSLSESSSAAEEEGHLSGGLRHS